MSSYFLRDKNLAGEELATNTQAQDSLIFYNATNRILVSGGDPPSPPKNSPTADSPGSGDLKAMIPMTWSNKRMFSSNSMSSTQEMETYYKSLGGVVRKIVEILVDMQVNNQKF